MFSIAFLLSSLSFIYEIILSLEYYSTGSNLVMENLFYWSSIPLVIAVFIASIESFFLVKQFDKILKIFLIVCAFCLIMVAIPVSVIYLPIFIYQIVAVTAITSNIYVYLRTRDLSSLLFLLALFSFAFAGSTMTMDISYLSIFPFLAGFVFISLVFVISSSLDDKNRSGIGSYFSLKRKLEMAKTALEESEEKLRSLLEYTPNIVMMVDCNGSILFVNRAIFGLTPEKIVGMNVYDFFAPKYCNLIKQTLDRVFQSGEPGRYETSRYAINGDISWYDVQIGPIKHENKVVAATLINTDITNQKQIEEKLGGSLQERNAEVEKLLKQKDELVKQLGHDLKNPLNPLLILLPLVEERVQDPKSKEMLHIIRKNVDYMKNLVTNTIQLARLDTPNIKFSLEKVNLFKEVNAVIEKNKLILDGNQIKIVNIINKKITVIVDKLRLEELLNNLINNAFKYSPKGGIITLNAKEDKNFTTISVRDTGIGMDKEQLNHVFDEFYKTDSINHDFESSGLGLSICKRITEKHGGRIWAESPGYRKGSIFYFTIPKEPDKVKDHISEAIDRELTNIEEKKMKKHYMKKYSRENSYTLNESK